MTTQDLLDDLAVDRSGEVPIGVQLAWSLRARIGDGRLRPGQRLPGLRELAEMLGINANTARVVYQRLEREGLIESVQGTGTFVADNPTQPSTVGEIAAGAAREARRTGVDPRAVAAALYVAADQQADGTSQDSERRSELRTQIAVLERTLAEIQARNPDLIPTPSRPPSRRSGPGLPSIAELERIRAQLVHRLALTGPLLEMPVESEPATNPAREPQTHSAGAKRTKRAKSSPATKSSRPRPATRPSTA